MTSIRTFTMAAVLVTVTAAPARADVFITAFFGASMRGVLDGSKTTLGGQLGFLGAGFIGVEGDFGYTMKVKGGHGGDNFRTLTGAVLIAPKLGSDRVRPYAAIGGGVINAVVEPKHLFIGDDTVESASLLSAGGGLFAFLSNHIGVRLDARYMKAMLDTDVDVEASHFIRVTGGLVIKF